MLVTGWEVLSHAGVRGAESPAAVEELRDHMQQQDERMAQLEAEMARQREVIRRLPGVESPTDPPRTDTADGVAEPSQEGSRAAGAVIDGEVQARVDRLEESLLGKEDPENAFLETPATETTRVVNGRIHIDQWGFPESSPGINVIETGNPANGPLDRLVYRRLRLGVGGSVPPGNMSYRLEIEFSGQDGSQFRDAWIGWDDLAHLGTIRFGNQKRPYGLDQLNSSNFNIFMERPFITDALNENNRRFGLAAYGASDNLAYNWRFGVFDIDLIQNSGSVESNKYPLELAGRLANTYWYDETSGGRGYAHVALAGTFAFPDPDASESGATDSRAQFRSRPEGRSTKRWLNTQPIDGCDAYQILGIESVVNVGRVQLVGEFMNLWLQRLDGYGPDMYMHGGYFYVSYFLTGEHIPWNRELGILGRVQPFEDFFRVTGCDRAHRYGTGCLGNRHQVVIRRFDRPGYSGRCWSKHDLRGELVLERPRPAAGQLYFWTHRRSLRQRRAGRFRRRVGQLPDRWRTSDY